MQNQLIAPMATINRFSFLAIFLGITMAAQHFPELVRGDAALVSRLCSNTERPDYCLYCFNRENKGSYRKTPIQLGSIAIRCSLHKAFKYRQRIVRYSRTNDPVLRRNARACRPLTVLLIKNLLSAWKRCTPGRVQDALVRAQAAQSNFEQCDDILGDHVPLSFVGLRERLEAYVADAPEILRQIH